MSEEKQPFNPSRGLLSSRRGGAGGKAARLPSLRTPRDLTLGGVQKKTFAPNIPARRKQEEVKPNTSTEKQPVPEAEKKKSHTGADHGDKATRGRRFEKRKADVVQSHSIFEQGPTEKSVRASSGYVNYGDTERSTTGKRTTIKKERPEDKETKQLLDDLLRDDFIVDDKIKTEDPSMAPVRLPLSMNTEVKAERDIKLPVKTSKGITVKEEPNGTEGMELDPNVPVVGDEVDIPSEQTTGSTDVMQPKTCAELFSTPTKSEEGQLVFIQLPDTLPGEPLTKPPVEKVKEKGEKADTKSAEDKLAEKLGQVGLSDFNEGHIGKLQILKSGRTRLLLGNNSLDVTLGTPAGFLQELVSVRLDGKTGDMCVLGHVNHKLVCLPDMESLLDSR